VAAGGNILRAVGLAELIDESAAAGA
jgi:hypothetical protein